MVNKETIRSNQHCCSWKGKLLHQRRWAMPLVPVSGQGSGVGVLKCSNAHNTAYVQCVCVCVKQRKKQPLRVKQTRTFLRCYGNAPHKRKSSRQDKLTNAAAFKVLQAILYTLCVFSYKCQVSKANRSRKGFGKIVLWTNALDKRHICQRTAKPLSWIQQGLKNSMMMLGEDEKPVIQQGAYIVIKSHVKKKEKKMQTHHPLSLARLQHFLSEHLLPTAKEKRKTLAPLQQAAHLS